jgi:transposase
MKAYSIDLRQKIIDAYTRQLGTQPTIAELFGVSASFVEKLLRRYRTTGDLAPKPHGGGRQLRLDAAAQRCIAQWVQVQPDLTLEELCTRTAQELGIRVSIPTMCRVLQRQGLPRKKRRSMPPSATRNASARLVRAINSQSARSRSTA